MPRGMFVIAMSEGIKLPIISMIILSNLDYYSETCLNLYLSYEINKQCN